MNTIFLYCTCVFIWGTTWLGIKLQLGLVDPLVSVFYRFSLAAAVLLIYCRARGATLTYRLRHHVLFLIMGLCLFGLNYWCFYLAEEHITSGLAAVVFSTIIFMNIVNGRLLLGAPIRPRVLGGACIGLSGMLLVFWPELRAFSFRDTNFMGLVLSILATYSASCGNIISAHLQKNGIPVLQTNVFGMTYGALAMGLLVLSAGKPFAFEASLTYAGSLLYLGIFGSVLAFGAYLTLVGRIGPDRAAYATLLFPMVALGLSTLFEDYCWSLQAACGMLLILIGNFLAVYTANKTRPPAGAESG